MGKLIKITVIIENDGVKIQQTRESKTDGSFRDIQNLNLPGQAGDITRSLLCQIRYPALIYKGILRGGRKGV